MEEHAAHHPDHDVDHRPLRRSRRTDRGRRRALVEDGQDQPEGGDADEGVDPCGELEHRELRPGTEPAERQRIHRRGSADDRDRRERERRDRRGRDVIPRREVEQSVGQQRRQREGTAGLGEGDPHVGPREEGHCGKPEVGADGHPDPPERQAHERGEVPDHVLREDPGGRPEQDAQQDVLGRADVSEPEPEAVEQQVTQEIAHRQDGEGGDGGLHPGGRCRAGGGRGRSVPSARCPVPSARRGHYLPAPPRR